MSTESAVEHEEIFFSEGAVSDMIRQIASQVNELGWLVKRVGSRCGGKRVGMVTHDIDNPNGRPDWFGVASELSDAIRTAVTNIDGLTEEMEDDATLKGNVIEGERMKLEQMAQMVLDMYAYGKVGLISSPTERLSHVLDSMIHTAASTIVYVHNPTGTGIKHDEIPF